MTDFKMYASADDVSDGFRTLSTDEAEKCNALIIEASAMVDALAPNASHERKLLVVCRMVRRVLGGSIDAVPMGTSQGTVSALGYSQTWSLGAGGSLGELYVGKSDKMLLGLSNKIGVSNPFAEGR